MSEPEAGRSPTEYGESGRHVEQETADGAEMVERVRAAGPDSAEAHHLREVLLLYGYGQLRKLHSTGKLLARVKSQLSGTLPASPDDWRSSAEALIYLSVRQSLDSFFMTAVFGSGRSRWRSNGGASITTYFTNKCLMTFKDLYLKECKNSGQDEIPCPDFDDEKRLVLYSTPEDPESRALDADQVRRIGQEITPHEARIVLRRYSGESLQEIGQDLDKSDEAVSSSLQRLRRRIGC